MLIGFMALYLIYCFVIINLPLIFDVLLFLVDLFWRWLWIFLKLPFQVIGKFYYWIERSTFAVWYWGSPLPQILGRIALKYCLRAGRGIRGAVVFLYYLVDEAMHGEEEEDYFDYEEDEPDEEQAQEDSYEKALKLLGLQAGCTQESFKHAFKVAMMQAHPDRGGTNDQAVAVGVARVIIKTQHNWR